MLGPAVIGFDRILGMAFDVVRRRERTAGRTTKAIPIHRTYRLADLARDCANEWPDFAERLDEVASRTSHAG